MHMDAQQKAESITIVPAQPGWFVCEFSDVTDPDVSLCKLPIIAWEIQRGAGDVVHHQIVPITVIGTVEEDPDDNYLFLDPLGRLINRDGYIFADEAEAIRDFAELAAFHARGPDEPKPTVPRNGVVIEMKRKDDPEKN